MRIYFILRAGKLQPTGKSGHPPVFVNKVFIYILSMAALSVQQQSRVVVTETISDLQSIKYIHLLSGPLQKILLTSALYSSVPCRVNILKV